MSLDNFDVWQLKFLPTFYFLNHHFIYNINIFLHNIEYKTYIMLGKLYTAPILSVHSKSFEKCACLCNLHHNKDIKHFHHPKKLPCASSQSTLLSFPAARQSLIYFLSLYISLEFFLNFIYIKPYSMHSFQAGLFSSAKYWDSSVWLCVSLFFITIIHLLMNTCW